MLFFDRILLILASCCLSAILMILFTGEINPKNQTVQVHDKIKVLNQEIEGLQEVSEGSVPESEDMIVYGEEIDQQISKYFQDIRNQPALDEEQKRIIDDIIEPDENLMKEIDDNKLKTEEVSQISQPKIVLPKYGFINYTVKPGESLWRISNNFKVPVYSIISANPDKSKKIIHPGDHLKIPFSPGIFYKVQRGDTLGGIAKKYKISVSSIVSANHGSKNAIYPGKDIFLPNAKALPQIRYIWQNEFIWPIAGRLTSGYGWRMHPMHNERRFHAGIDIGAKWGTRIRSVGKGIVIHAGNAGTYGNLVLIRHKNGYISAYAHCSSISVRSGALVNKGQIIARVGASGQATGSHLHFEMKHYQKSVNPSRILALKTKVPITVK